MSAAPFDVGLVLSRLQAADTGMREWGGRADYRSVTRLQDYPAPCGYVILARERGLQTKTGQSFPGKQTPGFAQITAVTFAVVMVVQNYRQFEGADLRDELREGLGKVRNPLLGWTPPVAGGRACDLIQGDLTNYDSSIAVWTDIWSTQHVIKPEIQQ
ncbi:hypothetical protein RDV84_00180 [Lysobacter yananisis]|uniref:Virion structural protein n=1 Tax=Lysobacter yananisis TaxID=1003114 RepID=A0ABY9P8A2_9GAMM|nr:hypothetical protein [Lysobacter yananisis]WMT03307.1 hypothetical protein RDV84_00180 [Lysobacter yananisis]